MTITTWEGRDPFLSSNQRSFLAHEEKVRFLEDLGNLLGCINTFTLSDGTIPDVLRINNTQDLLFIGDAKQTETPGNVKTQKKFFGYFSWLYLFSQRAENTGVFAICYGNEHQVEGWEGL